MVVKISACVRPETHYFKGKPRTGRDRKYCARASRMSPSLLCTGVRHTSHRPHSCTSVVMRAVQLCASTRLGCNTPVWKVSSHPYSCTDQVIQFVRVYTPYTLKSPAYSHHDCMPSCIVTRHENERSRCHQIIRGNVNNSYFSDSLPSFKISILMTFNARGT
jgi:hypothetical protein